MNNVEFSVKGDKLIITVDVSKKSLDAAPPSASGKTRLLASTGAAIAIPLPGANVTLAMNVMIK